MSETSRRGFLAALAAAGLGASQVHAALRQPGRNAELLYFTEEEFETLRLLVDLILPAEDGSPGAVDAKTTEFIDYTCSLCETQGPAFRRGLEWVDARCAETQGVPFRQAARESQTQLLDKLAYRGNYTSENAPGIEFFANLRGAAVDAYYTSPEGISELGYQGNQVLESFDVPEEALRYAVARSPFAVQE